MTVSIGIRDQSEIINYYKKFPTIQESTYLSVEMKKWKKNYENWFPLKNVLQLREIQPSAYSDISSHSQDLYYSSY